MAHYKINQVDLSKKSGTSQRTISNIVNADKIDGANITQGSIDKIAHAFFVQSWMLTAVEIPDSMMNKRAINDFQQFVEKYVIGTTKDREMIAHILSLV